MNLMEKYQSMNKGNQECDELDEKKEQKKVIDPGLFRMMESESEFDFIAIESREMIGLMYNEFIGLKK
jgi:hypothetical protein